MKTVPVTVFALLTTMVVYAKASVVDYCHTNNVELTVYGLRTKIDGDSLSEAGLPSGLYIIEGNKTIITK